MAGSADGRLVGDVLAWGVPRLRDLPWRRTRDPWAIVVSEVMLQQTQVTRVEPRWAAFMAAYPTPADCARVPLGDVLRRWEGLGYPRRARNLHATATEVVARYDGQLPSDLDALLALPGIGAYTARAVRAFAFGLDAAIVDTNVARVLARTSGRRLTAKGVQRRADELAPTGEAWVWNQVMLDLGATVCVARSPRCGECPIAASCAWARTGCPEPDPAVGSAGVSGSQARFEGSDRQLRGTLLRAVVRGRLHEYVESADGDRARVERVLAGLVADGLVVRRGETHHLP
ncbi:MAG: A/G-specific adenine glycosylase [Acidimicrobiia bacterium]